MLEKKFYVTIVVHTLIPVHNNFVSSEFSLLQPSFYQTKFHLYYEILTYGYINSFPDLDTIFQSTYIEKYTKLQSFTNDFSMSF